MNKNLWKDTTKKLIDATGLIQSIREWGHAGFSRDHKQRRSFKILLSSFLLTFYDEKPEDAADATIEARVTRSKCRKAKNRLGAYEEVKILTTLSAFYAVQLEVERVLLSIW